MYESASPSASDAETATATLASSATVLSVIAATTGAWFSPVVGATTFTVTLRLTLASPSLTLTATVYCVSAVTDGAVITRVFEFSPLTVNALSAVQLKLSGSLSASVADAVTDTLSPELTDTALDTDRTGALLLGSVTVPPSASCIALRISPLSASISHANRPPRLY